MKIFISVYSGLFWSIWKFLFDCDVFPKEVSKELSLIDELSCSLRLAVHFPCHRSVQSATIGNILKMSRITQRIFVLQTFSGSDKHDKTHNL